MTTPADTAQGAARYIAALEDFQVHTIDAFLALCAPGIEFRDPFNHTFGRDDFRRVLVHMLNQVDALKFVVCAHWRHEASLVIKWRFTGHARFVGQLDIPGMSEVTFDDFGLVSRHIDYWDANAHITCKLPLIGSAVRLAMRPMSS